MAETGRKTLGINALMEQVFRNVTKNFNSPDPVEGLRTGYKELDMILAGLRKGQLHAIASRTSMGKSALVATIALNVSLRQNAKVGYVTLQSSKHQFVQRLLCSDARVDMSRVRNGQLSERDFQRLADTAGRLAEAQWLVRDTVESVTDLIQIVEEWCKVNKVDVLIIDDIHAVPHPLTERHNSIVTLNHALKRLAIEYDIPIIVTAQVSKSVENRINKRPSPSDLHDSGFLEDIADVVLFIYRDEYYDPQSEKQGIAEIIIGKQRNGPVATVELQFHNAHVRFNDLAKPV